MGYRAVFLIGTGFALLAATAIGCAASDAVPATSQAYVPSATATNPPSENEDASTAAGSMPVAAAALPHALGSPLCNATYTSCYPDDPNTARAKLCVPLPDGGLFNASAGSDNAQLACHVQQNLAGVA